MSGLCVRTRSRVLGFVLGVVSAAAATAAPSPDHHEFDAVLEAPYLATAPGEARTFTLRFAFPDSRDPNTVAWRLELLAPSGAVLIRWHGEERLYGTPIEVNVPWGGIAQTKAARADGFYTVRLTAVAGDPVVFRTKSGALSDRVEQVLAETDEAMMQEWQIQIGQPPKPIMPAFTALPTAADVAAKSAGATAGLPYTVYFGNLHSQTNDSDGGGAIGTCTSSQAAQTGAFGPTDAFNYASSRLDILVASEHNHYFDGSSGTNTSANPTTARNRYQAGLTAATNFNAAHPGFLAVYGMEWGVISGGGHLNIFNSNELLAWEYNASNQLIGDTFTTKSDYQALYTLMRSRGWIGQFNHPSTSDQFPVGGTVMGYTADGDEAMVLAEILNTSAFSANTTETETSRSTYEGAFKLLLERGFHIAPSTNQDNHCANWGASYTNRTGVLIPNGTALSKTSFVDALRARRVYASMDKNSQLILTANGRVMGERFNNSGALTLTANFANSAGRTASQVQIYEGVPGRNGTVTLLSSTAVTTITPSLGAHFYYAKVTQDDGKILWSAPVWVTQVTATDSTAPTVSASETGTSGTITLAATASDNVGVTRVEFYIDNVLRGSDTTSPYSMTFNSTALANGSHSLAARAYDAAGNVGTSAAVSFSINNATSTQLIANPSFESGSSSWTATSGVITNSSTYAARTGTWKAWLNGYGSAHTDTAYQTVSIPSTATSATLSLWLRVDSEETGTTAFDTLKVQLRNTGNTVLTTLASYSNVNESTGYVQRTFNVLAYKGQTVRVYFEGIEGSIKATSFLIDDVNLTVQ
jgi:hypothetical protein